MPSTKRWGGLRPAPYNPNARDADHDGLVQEGTVWERPGGTKFVSAAGKEIAAAVARATPGSYIADADGNRVDYTPPVRSGVGPDGDVPDIRMPKLGDMGYPSVGETNGTIKDIVGTVEGPPDVPEPDRRDVVDLDAPEIPTPQIDAGPLIEALTVDLPPKGSPVGAPKDRIEEARIMQADRLKIMQDEGLPIMRGMFLNLDPETRAEIQRMLGMVMEDEDEGMHLRVGPMILDELKDTGLGTHWTASPGMAKTAAGVDQTGKGNLEVIFVAKAPRSSALSDNPDVTGVLNSGERELTFNNDTAFEMHSMMVRNGQEWLEVFNEDLPYAPSLYDDYGDFSKLDALEYPKKPEAVQINLSDEKVREIVDSIVNKPDSEIPDPVFDVDIDVVGKPYEPPEPFRGAADAVQSMQSGEYGNASMLITNRESRLYPLSKATPDDIKLLMDSNEAARRAERFAEFDDDELDYFRRNVTKHAQGNNQRTLPDEFVGWRAPYAIDKDNTEIHLSRPPDGNHVPVLVKRDDIVADMNSFGTSGRDAQSVLVRTKDWTPYTGDIDEISAPRLVKIEEPTSLNDYLNTKYPGVSRIASERLSEWSGGRNDALHEYSIKPGGINNIMRSDDDALWTPEALNLINGLSSVINGSRTEEEHHVYRGVTVDSFLGEDIAESDIGERLLSLVGTNVQDMGFLSTSASPTTAAKFLTDRDEDGNAKPDVPGIMMRIHVPEGEMGGAYIQTQFQEEEMLYQAETALRVKGVREIANPKGHDKPLYILDMEMVPPQLEDAPVQVGSDRVDIAEGFVSYRVDGTRELLEAVGPSYPTNKEKSVISDGSKEAVESVVGDSEEKRKAISDTVADYTGDWADFINRKLRQEAHLGDGSQKKIDVLDEVLAETETPVPYTSYRGLDIDSVIPRKATYEEASIEEALAKLVGTTVKDRGYLSSSLSAETAIDFAGARNKVRERDEGAIRRPAGSLIYEIDVPEGGQGLYVSSAMPGRAGGGEAEILLPRNSNLRVVGVEKIAVSPDEGRKEVAPTYVLKMELLPPTDEPEPGEIVTQIRNIGSSDGLEDYLTERIQGNSDVMEIDAKRVVETANVTYFDERDQKDMKATDALEEFVEGTWGDKANSALRAGDGSLPPEDMPRVEAVDGLIEATSALEDYHTYQGVTGQFLFGEDMEMSPSEFDIKMDALVGETIVDKGFVQTSLDPATAIDNAEGDGYPVVFRIHVPKEGKGLSVSEMHGYYDEKDVLLPRNSEFKITGVSSTKDAPYEGYGGEMRDKEKYYVVDMEAIQ